MESPTPPPVETLALPLESGYGSSVLASVRRIVNLTLAALLLFTALIIGIEFLRFHQKLEQSRQEFLTAAWETTARIITSMNDLEMAGLDARLEELVLHADALGFAIKLVFQEPEDPAERRQHPAARVLRHIQDRMRSATPMLLDRAVAPNLVAQLELLVRQEEHARHHVDRGLKQMVTAAAMGALAAEWQGFQAIPPPPSVTLSATLVDKVKRLAWQEQGDRLIAVATVQRNGVCADCHAEDASNPVHILFTKEMAPLHDHYDQQLLSQTFDHGVMLLLAGLATLLLRRRILEMVGRLEAHNRSLVAGRQELLDEMAGRRRVEEELAASTERFRSLVEHTSDWVWEVDSQFRYTYVNANVGEILGYAPGQVLGESLFHAMTGDGVERVRFTIQAAAAAREPFANLEVIRQHREGRLVHLECGGVPLLGADGVLRGFRGIERDVTERRLMQEALIARNVAESASRAKSAFLANMSHEIRSPMNAVIGMTDLALATRLTQEQRQYLDIVMQSSNALLGLLNSILDFSKIEAGRLELEYTDFSMHELVEQACETLAVEAHRKNLELWHDIDPAIPSYLLGDPVRLRQILVNLVGNAIKFTQYGEIRVGVRLEPCPGPEAEGGGKGPARPVLLHFQVQDTGIGLSQDKYERIFEHFTQADESTTRRFGGTGLGLAISRQLALLMGGEMWVESREGEGSVFHFTARFGECDGAFGENFFTSEVQFFDKSILVADSHLGSGQGVARVLTMGGARVTLVHTPLELAQLLEVCARESRVFDLTLFDCRLAGSQKTELLSVLTQYAQVRGVLILMLYTGARRVFYPGCQELQVESALIKPVKRRALVQAVNRALLAGGAEPVAEPVVFQPHPMAMVLVVDDNLNNQKVAADVLLKAGYQVLLAEDGVQALATLGERRCDLVLMDVQMPEMDGLHATRLIRRGGQKGVNPELPVIGVTAFALAEDRQRCLDSGMNAFLAKPYRAEELLRVVRQVLGVQLPSVESSPRPSLPLVVTPLFVAEHGLVVQRGVLRDKAPDLLTALAEGFAVKDYSAVEGKSLELREVALQAGASRLQQMAFKLVLAARAQDDHRILQQLERVRGTLIETVHAMDGEG